MRSKLFSKSDLNGMGGKIDSPTTPWSCILSVWPYLASMLKRQIKHEMMDELGDCTPLFLLNFKASCNTANHNLGFCTGIFFVYHLGTIMSTRPWLLPGFAGRMLKNYHRHVCRFRCAELNVSLFCLFSSKIELLLSTVSISVTGNISVICTADWTEGQTRSRSSAAQNENKLKEKLKLKRVRQTSWARQHMNQPSS